MKSARTIVLPVAVLLCAMVAFNWGLRNGLPPARREYRTQPATAFFLDFGAVYDTIGFSGPELVGEKDIQWTWYERPSIGVPLLPIDDAWVQFRVDMVVHPDFWDAIALEINGMPLDLHRNGQVYSAYIPREALTAGRQTLTFETPLPMRYNVANPPSLDWRLLGIAIDWLRIIPGTAFAIQCDMADGCTYDGMTEVEPGETPSRWTVGQATVRIPVVPGRALRADIRIAEAASQAAVDGLQVEADGVSVPFNVTVDGSGTQTLTVDLPPQEDVEIVLMLEAGDSGIRSIDGEDVRVGLRLESVTVSVAPQDVHFYDFTGAQLDGLSELQWDQHTTYQWMVTPEARVVLPSLEGAATLELGVLRAASEAQYDALTVTVNGQPVTLTPRSLLGREVYTGDVTLSGDQPQSDIVLRLPRLAETPDGRRGLGLDWVQIKRKS